MDAARKILSSIPGYVLVDVAWVDGTLLARFLPFEGANRLTVAISKKPCPEAAARFLVDSVSFGGFWSEASDE